MRQGRLHGECNSWNKTCNRPTNGSKIRIINKRVFSVSSHKPSFSKKCSEKMSFRQKRTRCITDFIRYSRQSLFVVTNHLSSCYVSFSVSVATVSAELFVRAQVQSVVNGLVLPLIRFREVCAAFCKTENKQELCYMQVC